MSKKKYILLLIPTFAGFLLVIGGLALTALPNAAQYKDGIFYLTLAGFVLAFIGGGVMWVAWRITLFFALLELFRGRRK